MDESTRTQVPPPGAASPDGAPTTPAPNAWAAIARIFTGPRAVFQAYAPKPAFLVPMLVVIVVHVGLGLVVSRSDMVKDATLAKLEERNTPPEQVEATERMLDSPLMIVIGTIGAGIGSAFIVLLSAALLYFMANLMLGARLTFAHYLCASAFGHVVGLADSLVRTGLMMVRGELHVAVGVGAFFGEATSVPIRFLDTLTSPLLLWSAAVMALGVSVFARKGFGFGALAALPGLLALSLMSAFQ